MFVRADVLWLQEKERSFPLHAVDFSWDGFEPALTCRDVQTGGAVLILDERLEGVRDFQPPLVIDLGRVAPPKHAFTPLCSN